MTPPSPKLMEIAEKVLLEGISGFSGHGCVWREEESNKMIAAIALALDQARQDGLEEAVRIASSFEIGFGPIYPRTIAEAIRNLKDKV